MKTCTKCHVQKPLEGFYKKGNSCKRCISDLYKNKYAKLSNMSSKKGYRRCKYCKLEKQNIYFLSKHQRRKNFTVACTLCRKKKRTCSKREMCKNFYESWKKSVSCLSCGINDYRIIQADHIGLKTYALSQSQYWASNGGIAAMETELKKCQPLCGFCHRLKTTRMSGTDNNPTRVKRINKINEMKLKLGKCVNCDKKVTLETCSAFDFDHIDPKNKTIMVSSLKRVNKKTFTYIFEHEISKCRLLCCNCHHIHTHYAFKK